MLFHKGNGLVQVLVTIVLYVIGTESWKQSTHSQVFIKLWQSFKENEKAERGPARKQVISPQWCVKTKTLTQTHGTAPPTGLSAPRHINDDHSPMATQSLYFTGSSGAALVLLSFYLSNRTLSLTAGASSFFIFFFLLQWSHTEAPRLTSWYDTLYIYDGVAPSFNLHLSHIPQLNLNMRGRCEHLTLQLMSRTGCTFIWSRSSCFLARLKKTRVHSTPPSAAERKERVILSFDDMALPPNGQLGADRLTVTELHLMQ